MNPDIDAEKRLLRTRFRALRQGWSEKEISAKGEKIAQVFLQAMDAMGVGRKDIPVAGYWPMKGEADVRPLMRALGDKGFVLALPVVTGPGRALEFRRWRQGDDLMPGRMGSLEPLGDAPLLVPGVVLLPLLAYDAAGFRLGMGGGHYDRSLESLRRRGNPLAVGIAHSAQRAGGLPHEDHDQRLDWVVTEQKAERLPRQ